MNLNVSTCAQSGARTALHDVPGGVLGVDEVVVLAAVDAIGARAAVERVGARAAPMMSAPLPP